MMESAPTILPLIDTDRPILILAGIHAGCYELFVKNGIRGVRDLKDRTVAISAMGSASHMFIASMVAYVGMNPQREIHWFEAGTTEKAMGAFMEGRADAFIAFPPQPQLLRAQKLGKVIVDTKHDRPWSQYYCCVLAANRDFVSKHPVATKRVLRAMLKATDICAENPMRAARYLVTKGYEPRYELALEALAGIPYNRWRSSDPQDTVRFHALRLYEAGMIKSNPEKIIAQGTDWRFLNELKKELKA
jgi:NitT/TauT family transport system substrate-binding protein